MIHHQQVCFLFREIPDNKVLRNQLSIKLYQYDKNKNCSNKILSRCLCSVLRKIFYLAAESSRKMKFIFVILSALSLTLADVFNGDEWNQVKSPLESPRNRLIMNKIFPQYSLTGKMNRGGRIAGGELAKLGQFVHQALLMTVDNINDQYVCGGAIISHNWILTVSLIR